MSCKWIWLNWMQYNEQSQGVSKGTTQAAYHTDATPRTLSNYEKSPKCRLMKMKGDGNDHKVAEQMSETETPWHSATDADMPLVECALPFAAYTTVILSHNQCDHRCGDIRCPAAAVTKQQTKQTNYRRVLHLMHACMWWSGGGWIYSHMDVTFKKKSLKAAFQKLSVALLAWFCTHCMTQWPK